MSYVHVLFHSIFNFSAQSVMGVWVLWGEGWGGGFASAPVESGRLNIESLW